MPNPVYAILIRPLLFCLDAEAAHKLAVQSLHHRLLTAISLPDDSALRVSIFGKTLRNPIGLAAGFDKDAEAMAGTLDLGFGFTEVGTITPLPQPGNPKPRIFRIPSHQAVLNRYGFNSKGLDDALERLKSWQTPAGTMLGVNVGKNKTAPDTPDDFVTCAKAAAPYADYLVVNVSSPNTPGLRGLQNRDQLQGLLVAVKQVAGVKPVLVKLAPDLDDAMLDDIADVALATEIDGIIATNTTVTRPADLPLKNETGGLSGAPLKDMAQAVLSGLFKRVGKQMPLIGVGGIGSAEDAYARVRAGATLIQLYTALIYQGPSLVSDIAHGLSALLKRDGFASVADAVGVDHT